MTRACFAASVGLAAVALVSHAAAARQQIPPAATPDTRIEVVAVDRDGRPVEGLGPSDFLVTIDGVARPVVSVRRVSRGPGAVSDAARRQGAAGHGQSFAAEPVRSVMVIVDQAMMVLGDEKTAVQASRAFLDRLGLADRVAVVRLPFSADQRIELSSERPAAREALARVRGQAARASRAPADAPTPPPGRPVAVTDPDQVVEAQPTRPERIAPELEISAPEAELARASNSLAAIAGILRSLEPVPGRKVVAIFSAGFADSPAQARAVADASASAIAGGATIYAFGLPSLLDDSPNRPDTSALETLAKNTGGSYARLGGKPEKLIERAMDDLLSVYVLGLAPAPAPAGGDVNGRRRPVTVQTPRKDLTLRAPAWLLPVADPGDVLPAAEEADPATAAADRAAPGSTAVAGGRAAAAPDRDADLPVALARLFDYVRAYEAQYSALVAEEEFQQVTDTQSVRTRSDVLLVQQASAGGWVSFRDVFEVNGKLVRDREDRLRKLFLDPEVDAYDQLKSIVEESARYNVGPVERNINVPLLLLKFLRPANRSRSTFRIGARPEIDGVQTWRIDFTEVDRPTLIRDANDADVPVKGHFLVEQSTGAILETRLRIDGAAYTADIAVTFLLDPGLGMWVPSRMNETYRTQRSSLVGLGQSRAVTLQGEAKYSKFRRFQVKTEETVAIKK